MEKILVAYLWSCGTYNERQMLKRNEIVECAEAILRRFRKHATNYRIALGVTPAVFVLAGFAIGGMEIGAMPFFMAAMPLIFILFPLFELRLRILKLESNFSIWLVSKLAVDSDVDLLSDPRVQFILGDFEWGAFGASVAPTDVLNDAA